MDLWGLYCTVREPIRHELFSVFLHCQEETPSGSLNTPKGMWYVVIYLFIHLPHSINITEKCFTKSYKFTGQEGLQ